MSETNYIPVRKDFVFDAKCHACPQPLKSNVATILKDENGKEYPFGPVCAKKAIDLANHALLKQIPDFTKATLTQETGVSSSQSHGGKNRNQNPPMDNTGQELTRAITYLLLRQRKLSHISVASYKPFSDYVDTFDNLGTLPQNAVTHIINLEKNQSTNKYGFNNLQAVYAYDCCIT